MNQTIRFSNPQQFTFYQSLKQRVQTYFSESGKSSNGGWRMIGKGIFWILAYLIPLALLIGVAMPWWLSIIAFVWLGIALAGIGMGVMHDACHNAFSDKGWVNTLFGSSIYMIGGNKFSWKMQHNVFHHTFTNIHGIDEDISGMTLLRFDRHLPLKKVHRYQHWYAPLLYAMMTLSFYVKDVRQAIQWSVDKGPRFLWSQMVILVTGKAVYFGLLLVLPLVFSTMPWWFILIGFLVINMVAGFIMAIVFQLAHVVEGADQPLPNQEGHMDNSWAVHQLQTTANFSPKNRILTWYLGGLNYQIEHHLFPNISHIHYPAIARIVRETAAEFGHTYNAFPSMAMAVNSHLCTLRDFGRA
ncbi:MAG: acyl-CoA desaturase [Sphingomonadales bacterium]|nr:acyl-CoA desaturase [Sphingomonadales bacterium]